MACAPVHQMRWHFVACPFVLITSPFMQPFLPLLGFQLLNWFVQSSILTIQPFVLPFHGTSNIPQKNVNIQSSAHSFSQSAMHSVSQSVVPSIRRSFNRSFVYSFVFLPSFISSFTHFFMPCHVRSCHVISCHFINRLADSSVHRFIDSLILP